MPNMPAPRQSTTGSTQPQNAGPARRYPLTIRGSTTHPLRPEQQAAHELQVGSDGFVYQGGRRFSTGTWDESRYVMGADGKMYADRPVRTDGMFPDNHTSFLAGQPAAAAGEVEAHGGVIKSVNNSSGHYAPTVRHTDQMLEELKTRGVDTSRIQNNKTF